MTKDEATQVIKLARRVMERDTFAAQVRMNAAVVDTPKAWEDTQTAVRAAEDAYAEFSDYVTGLITE